MYSRAKMVSSNLRITVTRHQPEILKPTEPTPYEWKQLSDIDDQGGMRLLVKAIWFYPPITSMAGKDPAEAIRRGLSKAMDYYYPIAGRLREGQGGKLSVECNGQGILFVEAGAHVSLQHFGGDLRPPFPCMDELFLDVHESIGIVDSPLMVVQVTRLACGGFIVSSTMNHAILDGRGAGMFMRAAAELSCGANAPSVLPVWERERLCSRSPPQVTHLHREYDEPLPETIPQAPKEPLSIGSVFLTRNDVDELRARLPAHLRRLATSFDILASSLWRCRTIALEAAPDQETRLLIAVDSRGKLEPPLPEGFYGNAVMPPAAVTKVEDLIEKGLEYGVELVRSTKKKVTEEYVRSVADLLVLKGRPHHTVDNTYLISDFRYAGFRELDWGWGKPLFGGPADVGEDFTSYLMGFRNSRGDDGVLVPICLPESAMVKFMVEFERMVPLAGSNRA